MNRRTAPFLLSALLLPGTLCAQTTPASVAAPATAPASQPALFLAPIQQLAAAQDPELQAQLAAVVEYQGALARWALDTRKLAPERRQAALQWAAAPRAQAALTAAYAADPARRVVAAHALASQKEPEAALLLARLIADPDRQVHLAAMEAAWHTPTPPAPELTEALWNRAVTTGLDMYRTGFAGARVTVRFRGRALPEVNSYYGDLQILDIEPATETLLHLKPPELSARLVAFYQRLAREPDLQSFGGGQFDSFAAVSRLTEAVEPREVVPTLYKLATGAIANSTNLGNGFWTNRTAHLATLAKITGQDPADYELRRSRQFNNNWVAPSQKQEEQAIEKLRTWWKNNKDTYLNPATAPASAPASRP